MSAEPPHKSGTDRLERKLAFGLIVALLLFDIGLRAVDQALSGNLAHVEEIPSIIGRFTGATDPSLLVVGNSLSNNGISPAVLTESLPSLLVAKVTPDGTNLWDWQCVLRHQVLEREDAQINTIVIGFAWNLLSDQTPPNASRLGGHFCDFGDLHRPQQIGLTSVGGLSEFTLARILRSYALRDLLRNRFLDIVIPGYEQFTQTANSARAGASDAVGTGNPHLTYQRLSAIASQLAERNTRLIVVAMPVAEAYPLDDGLVEMSSRGLFRLLDYRVVAGINSASFLDSMHLNEHGQAILSRRLGADLLAETGKTP